MRALLRVLKSSWLLGRCRTRVHGDERAAVPQLVITIPFESAPIVTIDNGFGGAVTVEEFARLNHWLLTVTRCSDVMVYVTRVVRAFESLDDDRLNRRPAGRLFDAAGDDQ